MSYEEPPPIIGRGKILRRIVDDVHTYGVEKCIFCGKNQLAVSPGERGLLKLFFGTRYILENVRVGNLLVRKVNTCFLVCHSSILAFVNMDVHIG